MPTRLPIKAKTPRSAVGPDAGAVILRKLALLNMGVMACAALIAVIMVLAAIQAVGNIDSEADKRESIQLSRALDAVNGPLDPARLAVIAQLLDLTSARIGTIDKVQPVELSVAIPADAGRVVAWIPHRFGSSTFETVAPLRLLVVAIFILVTAFSAWRIHLISRDLAQSRAAATQLAATDSLTGVGNRLAFDQALEKRLAAKAAGGPDFVLMFLDLDGFKAINDELGHATGDTVLQRVAGHLRAASGPDDDVARVGGDEFAVLRSGEGLDEFIADVRWRIAVPLSIGDRQFHIGGSIGVAHSEHFGTSPAHLSRAADEALYRAKRSGSGRAEVAVPDLMPQTPVRPKYAARPV